jgi:uncharacterized protein (DUF1697 family)
MAMHVALLRAVNLGSHNKVGMADLRGFFTQLGLTEPRSLLRSGNVVFGSDRRTGKGLKQLLEREAAKRLDLRTDFFVRSAREWRDIVARNPFPREAERDPAHLVLIVLREAPEDAKVRELQAAIVGREVVRTDGRHAYVLYPDGIGTSRLSHASIERRLGTRGTGRNWNTVLKLDALAGCLSPAPNSGLRRPGRAVRDHQQLAILRALGHPRPDVGAGRDDLETFGLRMHQGGLHQRPADAAPACCGRHVRGPDIQQALPEAVSQHGVALGQTSHAPVMGREMFDRHVVRPNRSGLQEPSTAGRGWPDRSPDHGAGTSTRPKS